MPKKFSYALSNINVHYTQIVNCNCVKIYGTTYLVSWYYFRQQIKIELINKFNLFVCLRKFDVYIRCDHYGC